MGKHRRKVPAYPEAVRAAMAFYRRSVGQAEMRHLEEICDFMRDGLEELAVLSYESRHNDSALTGAGHDAPTKPPG